MTRTAKLRTRPRNDAGVEVLVAPEPFSPRVEALELPAFGQNVAAILAAACNQGALPVDDLARARVYVNGVGLAEELGDGWLDYVPKAGDIVNVAVHPLGGGGGGQGGGDKVLQTVLTIALIAVSFFIGGPSGPLAASSVLVRAGAAAAIQVGGSLILGAIFKPDSPNAAPEANQRAALQGSTNQFRLRAPMPLRLGRQRVAFDLAAGPYTQLVGNDVWLKLIFGLHYGPCTLEDVKIGETLLAEYPAADVEVEEFLTPGARVSSLYPGRVVQENYSDELEEDVAEVHTTATDAERIEVDVVFPQGLSYQTNKGVFTEAGAHLLLEVQPAAGGAWTPADLPAASAPAGPLEAGSYYVQTATRDTLRATIAFEPPSKGQWNVRVTLKGNSQDAGGGTLTNKTFWTSLRTLEAEAPLVDETLSVLVMSIRSSEDLNGNLPTVSGLVTPIVPVWNGSDWSEEEPSSNAAALARWLVSGPAAANPMEPAEEIDDSSIDAFELIAENDWETVAVDVTDEASQQDVLVRLGKAGRFSTYWNGRKLCFVPDWSKPFPRQVFTGRNAQGYRYRRAFPDELHAVIVEFYPLDLTAPADEVIVYDDGYDSSNAELFETLRLDFSCEKDRAFREGRAYLAKRTLQVEVHEWQAGLDAVATTYGDRVLVRHPATLYGLADGTVDHRIFSGALVAGFKLDEAVAFESGKTYGVDIRRADSVIRGVPIINPATTSRTITFATPRATNVSPERGDLVVVGELGVVTEDVEIVDVSASSDGTVTFRGLRYIADALALAETGEIPEFTSGLAPRASAPTPRIVAAEGSPEGVNVAFDIDPVRSALVSGFAARWRIAGENELEEVYPWRTLPPIGPSQRSFRTPAPSRATGELDVTGEVHPEVAVDIEVRSVLKTGSTSSPGTAYGVLCIRGVPDVEDLEAEGAIRTGADGSSYPVIVVSALARVDGQVQDLVVQFRSADDPSDDWTSAVGALPAAAPVGDVSPVKAGDLYDVRARWRTSDNWVGAWSTIENVQVPTESLVAWGVRYIGGMTPAEWVEEFADAAALGEDLLARTVDLLARADDLLERSGILAEGVLANAIRNIEDRVRVNTIGFLPGGIPVNVGILDETTARIEGDEVIVSSIDALYVTVGDDIAAAIASEATIRASADAAEAVLRETLAVRVDDAEAAIVTEATTRADDDDALASLITALTSTVAGNTADIVTEASTRASADTAITSSITALTSTVSGNTAAIASEASTRASADSALSSSLSTLSSTVAGNTAAIASEASTRASADSALTSSISSLSSTVSSNTAAIASESSTRASADSALSSSISTLSTTVGGHTSSISTLSSSVSGILASYTVAVDVDGHVAGIQLLSGGGISSFVVLADEIAFTDGSTDVFPFSIVGGIVRATDFEADRVKANTITATEIISNSIDATYAVGLSSPVYVHDGAEHDVLSINVTTTGLLDIEIDFAIDSNIGGGASMPVLFILYLGTSYATGTPLRQRRMYTFAGVTGLGLSLRLVGYGPGPGTYDFTVSAQRQSGSGYFDVIDGSITVVDHKTQA